MSVPWWLQGYISEEVPTCNPTVFGRDLQEDTTSGGARYWRYYRFWYQDKTFTLCRTFCIVQSTNLSTNLFLSGNYKTLNILTEDLRTNEYVLHGVGYRFLNIHFKNLQHTRMLNLKINCGSSVSTLSRNRALLKSQKALSCNRTRALLKS